MERGCRLSIQPSNDTQTAAVHDEESQRAEKRVRALSGSGGGGGGGLIRPRVVCAVLSVRHRMMNSPCRKSRMHL